MATAALSSAEPCTCRFSLDWDNLIGCRQSPGQLDIFIRFLKARLRVQEKPKRAVIQSDPDYGETILGMFKLICHPFYRGRISWDRRCELLVLLANDGVGLFEVREYEKPHSDPAITSIGMFLEPTAAFLAELGLLESETAPLGQAL